MRRLVVAVLALHLLGCSADQKRAARVSHDAVAAVCRVLFEEFADEQLLADREKLRSAIRLCADSPEWRDRVQRIADVLHE